jgi:HD-GYP domain-containing protein (c-di-GMP phosphodiesterase class II)
MSYAVSPQLETDYWSEYFRLTGRYGDSERLHELRTRLRNQGYDPSDFFAWFSAFENLLAEIYPSRKQAETYRVFIKSVTLLMESQDPYTARHQTKVSEIAGCVAQELGLSDDMIEGIRVAGMVHDMGKMSLPAEVVNKPAALTPFELSIIREHPQKAYMVLKGIEFPWPIAEIVLQHHERVNGTGYPRGLKGNEIRLEARVLAVADVVEAISSRRPYRSGLGIGMALEEIDKNKGVFYDTEVAEACERSLKGTSAFMADQ